MPLASHHIDFSNQLSLPSHPVGMFSLIGGDGNHYVIVADPDIGGVSVGCAETDSVVNNITQAEWRTDGAALTCAATATLNAQCCIPIPGTDMFYVVGTLLDAGGGGGKHAVLFVRYKINSTASVTVDGTLGYMTSAHKQVPVDGYCFGARSIGGSLYAVLDTGTFFPSHQASSFLKLPITGSSEDLTVGSFDAVYTDISAELPWAMLRNSGTRRYYNRIALVEDPDGIGVIFYWGQTEADLNPAYGTTPAVFFCVVDPDAHTVSALEDVSADYGAPFSDTQLNYAGTAGTVWDDYTAPSVTDDNEIIFTRGFSDSKQYFRYQRFSHDPMTGAVEFMDSDVIQCSAISVTTDVEDIELFREGDSVNTMERDGFRLIFLSFTLPLTPVTPGGSGRRFSALVRSKLVTPT